jgi:hypothetical protein
MQHLKNVITVIHNAGLFKPDQNNTGRELWDLTWALVDPFAPKLKFELFPHLAPSSTHTAPVPVLAAPAEAVEGVAGAAGASVAESVVVNSPNDVNIITIS